MAVEDVGGEEEEEVMTMEVEIVRTLVGTVVEAGTLVEEATVETVVGMVETMTKMDRERHEHYSKGQGEREREGCKTICQKS